MTNPEQFSPVQEFKKMEQEMKFNLGERRMAFPELWGPEQKAKKEEIRQAAIKEISEALQANDLSRASELMEEVKRYFGEVELQKRESEQETFEPESRPETEIAREIHELIKESDWKKAIDRLRSYEHEPFYFLSLASEMREFDPKRFDNEIEVSDELWQKLVGVVEYERNYPDYFLKTASALQSLNPERFERDVKIDDKYWDRISSEIEGERNYPKWFVRLYDMAQRLDKERVQKQVPIDEGYWDKIKLEVEKMGYCPECEGMTAGAAQRVKPEGFPDITITKDKWEQIKKELEEMVKYYGSNRMFFTLANDVKDVKIK